MILRWAKVFSACNSTGKNFRNYRNKSKSFCIFKGGLLTPDRLCTEQTQSLELFERVCVIFSFLNFLEYKLPPDLEAEFQDQTNEWINKTAKVGIPLISLFIWVMYFTHASPERISLFNLFMVGQVVLVVGFLTLFLKGRARRMINYFTAVLPVAYIFGLMKLHVAKLPGVLEMSQAQNWIVWLVLFLYAFERVSPVIAVLNAGSSTILFFWLRGQIPELSGMNGFQISWLIAAAHGSGLIICFDHSKTARRKFKFERELQAARSQSDDLLHNVLPDAVVKELKNTDNRRFAHRYNNVSVLFVDLVGFTKKSDSMEGERLVMLLDELFSRFDDLAAKFGVEKIKTIGDAYMAATGCPEPDPEHARRIVDFALQLDRVMATFNRDYDVDFKIKIGISSGVVMGGVIGKKRVSFDLWGDTVNLASRIESVSKAGEISISETTAALITDRFELAGPRVVDLKGKGPTTIYTALKSKATAKMAA